MLNRILMGVVIALLIVALIPPILTHVHEYDWTLVVRPNCTAAGVSKGVCKCGKEITSIGDIVGHQITNWTILSDVTCTTDGSKEGSCDVCGFVSRQIIPALGHSYGEWVVSVPATCTQSGEEVSKCKNCVDQLTREIPAQHTFVNTQPCAECGVEYYSQHLDYQYIEKEGCYVVAGIGTNTDIYVVIPDEIDGKPVLRFADFAFKDNHSIQKVTFGSNITTIGLGSFYNCRSLLWLEFPDDSKLTTIRNGAFQRSEYLRYVHFPDSLETIETSAFEYCFRLEEVTLSANLKEIGPQAFLFCEYLQEITIPASVEVIGNGAFLVCERLATVTFEEGSNLREIGQQAFSCCDRLAQFTVPASVTKIGRLAFGDLNNLQSITFEDPNGWVAVYDDGRKKDIDVTDDGKNAINFTSRERYGYCTCIKK